MVPVGSGGTLAGLVVGVKEAGLNIPVIGLAVCDDTPTFVKIVDDIAAELHKDYGYNLLEFLFALFPRNLFCNLS